MLPEKLHLEQISRFHNMVKQLTERIKNETDVEKRGELSIKYFELSLLHEKIDEFIEFTVKQELDSTQLDS